MRSFSSPRMLFCVLAGLAALGTMPASAQPASGGATGGGADQGGSGAPGGGTGVPGAVARGTTRTGIGTATTPGMGRHHRRHHRAM